MEGLVSTDGESEEALTRCYDDTVLLRSYAATVVWLIALPEECIGPPAESGVREAKRSFVTA